MRPPLDAVEPERERESDKDLIAARKRKVWLDKGAPARRVAVSLSFSLSLTQRMARGDKTSSGAATR